MRNARVLCAAIVVVTLGWLTMMVPTAPSVGAAQGGKDFKEHWRYHDGRWSYWFPQDRTWYYTDGKHWFYEDRGGWKLYRFDKGFARGFERGEYKMPGINVKIELPNHGVFQIR